jgi:phosphoserine phosphatase RsbU/P
VSVDGLAWPQLQSLVDQAPCGLLLTSTDGTIHRVNGTFCRWTGFDEAELVGRRKLQDLLTMGGRIFHQTHWAPLLQMQGSVAEVKLEIVHHDGHAMPMVMNACRSEQQGLAFHQIAVFSAKDRHQYEHELLLARRRAEEILAKEQQAQQALAAAQAVAEDRAVFAEQMVGIVSHDLRNPLSAIQMGAYVLTRGDLSPNQARVIERVTNATSRANRLIADLLDFTQARVGGGLKMTLKPVDLHALVADSIDELALAFADRELAHQRVGEGTCRADADRLVQMIGNLVGNAMAYGAAGAPVTVTSVLEPQRFLLKVHNFGSPIDPALMPRLFEPMSRGHESSASGRSVGLGLFIVREIARGHGGTVKVESTAADGTTFIAEFPRGG